MFCLQSLLALESTPTKIKHRLDGITQSNTDIKRVTDVPEQRQWLPLRGLVKQCSFPSESNRKNKYKQMPSKLAQELSSTSSEQTPKKVPEQTSTVAMHESEEKKPNVPVIQTEPFSQVPPDSQVDPGNLPQSHYQVSSVETLVANQTKPLSLNEDHPKISDSTDVDLKKSNNDGGSAISCLDHECAVCDPEAETSLAAHTPGADKFTVKELLSSITDAAPSIPSNSKVLFQEKSTSSHSSEKSEASNPPSHLNSAVDDVIHVIRHSKFRVGSDQTTSESVVVGSQNIDVDKVLLNVLGGEQHHQQQQREENQNKKQTAFQDGSSSQDFVPSLSRREEPPLVKEAMDVKSFRQRAEALEGLLEMSAELLDHNRLEELSVILKPFGKVKVSPRETAIWLARSLKGMNSDDPR